MLLITAAVESARQDADVPCGQLAGGVLGTRDGPAAGGALDGALLHSGYVLCGNSFVINARSVFSLIYCFGIRSICDIFWISGFVRLAEHYVLRHLVDIWVSLCVLSMQYLGMMSRL